MLSRSTSVREITNTSMNGNAMNNSAAFSKTPVADRSSYGKSARTPASGKDLNKSSGKTPSGKLKNLTPSRNQNHTKTPGGDRFIPNRSATNFELGYFLATNQDCHVSAITPQKIEQQRMMSESLNGGITGPDRNCSMDRHRILAYQHKAPAPLEGYANAHKVMYNTTRPGPTSCKKSFRHIPSQPERILDAPEIRDDYYLNLVDWSATNGKVAVALGQQVYVWHASSGSTQLLTDLSGSGSDDYWSGVSWDNDGNYLSLGNSKGEVQLWDVAGTKLLRTMSGHSQRVGALAWNKHVCTSGSRTGVIHHHDVRVANHLVGTVTAHTQEVCGLRWSPDGRYLASGANDNLLHIWQQVSGGHLAQSNALYSFSEHQAAVKALAWCPWQSAILASGGGTNDRNIKLWNCNTGSRISSTDTSSQVCSLVWCTTGYRELVSGHGFPNHELNIWSYPDMTKITELTGHTARVLHLALSPCGQLVLSASADESLRIWHCFAQDPTRKTAADAKSGAASRSNVSGTFAMRTIR